MSDARFDIFTVLNHYDWDLPGERGVWQSVRCHAHDDSHASARISSDTGYVVCLACGIKWDAIAAVQHYERLTYGDAVARCEAITGTSDNQISNARQSGRHVSRKPGNHTGGRRYNPPRVRRTG